MATQPYHALKGRPKPPTIIVVRHGETYMDDGVQKFQGVLDEHLDNVGLREALATAEAIAPMRPLAVYSSDLPRAQQTAQIISEECDAPLTAAGLLRPWSLGEIVGMDIEEGMPILLKYATKTPDKALPGEDSESYNEWVERYMEALAFYVLEPTLESGGPCVLVEHSLNISLMKAWIAAEGGEIDPDMALDENEVEPGSYFLLAWDGEDWDIVGEPE